MLGDAGIFVAWKILAGLSVCDIRMDSSDRKEISHSDIARQKAVRPRFPAFVRKATVFTALLTLSDKNCQRYATFAKRAQWLCLPIATLPRVPEGVGKRQVKLLQPHGTPSDLTPVEARALLIVTRFGAACFPHYMQGDSLLERNAHA
ncbi:hypothetical protein ACQKGL_24440 [Ensifer adhaerens]|uniref:hypothetical protein n=1 Tax=Ensifer adhaerens TaxID=106592 RepID=UPI003D034E19